jgi:pimeloyl-ACP methyl ester carboxylesterase
MADATIEVDGRRVHYVVSGAEGSPTLLLIHGGGAHTGWWHLLTPLLEDEWRAVAIDLSGHGGDSDRRPEYALEHWVEEVVAVAEAIGDPNLVLVGHSMGGGVALATAALAPTLPRGVALLDSAVWWPGLMRLEGKVRPTVYPTREAAIAAFRLMPPQPVISRAAEEWLAPMSIAPRDGGWTWKWDPAALHSFDSAAVRELLPRVRCPVVEIIGGESDLVTAEAMEMLEEEMRTPVPCIEVPGAYHHVILDRPAEVAAALAPYLREWTGVTSSGSDR